MSAKNLWLDTKPAVSLGQIYQSCLARLKDIKTKLDLLDTKYQIDEQNRFRTLSTLSASLKRVRQLVGIADIKSKRDIVDIIKVINQNIKINNEEKEKEMQREALNRQILIQEVTDDPEESEEKLKQELRAFFIFSNKLTKIIREKQEENSQLNNLDKKKFDPLITPLLSGIRKNYIKISQQDELDLESLISVLDQSETALEQDYKELIDSMEIIAFTCHKYLLSFYQEGSHIESKMVGKLSDLLEQVVKYDSKKSWLFKYTKKYINYLRNIHHSFSDPNGVSLKQFSDTGHKISARFDLDHLQVLLIIPENSYLLNECVKMLREWIEYDSLYAKMVENDIMEIEKKRKALLNDKKYFDRLFSQLVRRLDLIRKELVESSASLKVNLIEMCTKRPSFGADLRIFFDQVEMELSLIEKEMNKLNLVGSTDVLKWSMLKGKLECLEYHMRRNYGMKKIEQHDLDVLDAGWLNLKNIHLYKTSDQTVEKIFYALELPRFKFGHHAAETVSNTQPINGKIVKFFSFHDCYFTA
ncbi:hypothetical protein BpHYR1_003681 [Brachionus plicatilis]|uniref:Uncharacterized protein n=1 Tax=Brachionus plicatilis TaxID=10195 RepID=A0A3M7RSL7_BRAPC|nr:hypothetical protein BpHYR1_003681 [Brachionus plicatilis]